MEGVDGRADARPGRISRPPFVMRALGARIHAFISIAEQGKPWMAGPTPGQDG